jgi:predicted nucleotide-binding protein (sugar kinase/HSP70/actin superfamily)
MDILKEKEINFVNPFIPFDNKKKLTKRLYEELKDFNLTFSEISKAVDQAWLEMDNFQEDIRHKGEEVLEYLAKTGNKGIVLAGRPYHIDPL